MFRNSLYPPPPQRRYCKELPLWLPLFGYSFLLCQFDFSVLISVTLIVCAWDNKLKLFLAYLQLKKGYERCSFFYHLCGIFFLVQENYQCRRSKIDKRHIDKVDISILSFQGVKGVFLQVFANLFCSNNYLQILLALIGLFFVYLQL